MRALLLGMGLLWVTASAGALSTPITIEPDDFADGTELDNVSPWVTLGIEVPDGSGGLRLSSFNVTATDGDFGPIDASPTGNFVFAHEDIPFLPLSRVMRGDFDGVTDSVSVLFAPTSTIGGGQAGRLEAYDSAGNLLAFDQTPILFANNTSVTIATLSIDRPAADIAFFRAYSPVGEFGRFDALTFNTPVPEPSTAGLFALAASIAIRRRRVRA